MSAGQVTEPAVQAERPRRFLKTFGLQTLDLAFRTLQQILLVPVLLHKWGAAVYQDWIIIFAAAGFLLVLDFGMQTYFVNSLLVLRIRDDGEAFGRLVSIAMTLYLTVLSVALAVCAAIVMLGARPAMLGVTTLGSQDAGTLAALLGGAILMLLPLGIHTGIYRIRGNYDLSVLTGMLTQTAPGFALCLIALGGGGPIAGAASYFVAAVLAWILVAADQRRRYGGFAFGIAWPTVAELRTVVAHSLQYMVSNFASPITLQVPVLLLGIWSSAGAVVPYVITRTLVGLVRQVVSQSSLPIGVELAQLYRGGDEKGARRLFGEATRLSTGVAGLLCGYLVVVAPSVLRLWTHDAVAYDPWLIGIFLCNVMCVAPAQIAVAFFLSINQPRPLLVSTTWYAALAVTLCVFLVGRYAAVGAALAFGIAEILCIGLVVPYAACKRIGSPVVAYVGLCVKFLAIGIVIGYGAMWIISRFASVDTFVGLIVMSLLWTAVISLPGYLWLLNGDMRLQLRRLFRGGRPAAVS